MYKKHLFYIIVLSTTLCVAQIVNIPDANFKNALVNDNVVDIDGDEMGDTDADTNNDGEIQLTEAQAVLSLNVSLKNIASMEGIQSFTNLEILNCKLNDISTMDITALISLEKLDCANNELISLDTSQNVNLEWLVCHVNELTNLDVSQNSNLGTLSTGWNNITALDVSKNQGLFQFYCENNLLTSINLSQNPELMWFRAYNNLLTSLNVKNGNIEMLVEMRANLNPDLFCIQVDDVDYANNHPQWTKDATASYSEQCVLNVTDVQIDSPIKLYPNPTNDILNIEGNSKTVDNVKIVTLQGVVLMEVFNANRVDMSSLPSGVYLIRLISNEQTITKRIIKI
jgi:hypothetical protein